MKLLLAAAMVGCCSHCVAISIKNVAVLSNCVYTHTCVLTKSESDDDDYDKRH